MARIGPQDVMPCGCRVVGNCRVLLEGAELRQVVAFDTETRTAEVLVRDHKGSLQAVGGRPLTALVIGPLSLECKTHGRLA